MKRKLTDILNGGADSIREVWNATEAAGDFATLPRGTYEAHLHSIELFNAKKGTPGVKIRFDVCAGEYAGRCVFHDCWLTAPAMPQTKRDLIKLGIDTVEKLETLTVPPGRVRCSVKVALCRDDDGAEYNRVKSFEVVGIDEPQRDAFAPADDGAEADAAGDATFDFGANVKGGTDER